LDDIDLILIMSVKPGLAARSLTRAGTEQARQRIDASATSGWRWTAASAGEHHHVAAGLITLRRQRFLGVKPDYKAVIDLRSELAPMKDPGIDAAIIDLA
jgi:hypothetical protein